jgi:fused signal recognition particle receptor
MAKTREAFSQKLENLALGQKKIDKAFVEQLEELLYTSDLGPKAVQKLLGAIELTLSRGGLSDLKSLKDALITKIDEILNAATAKHQNLNFESAKTGQPWVILVVGVNGVGKTTSIGKLAHFFSQQNRKVLIVAGDTFRAAAGAQLGVWGERAHVDVFNSVKTTEPAAVAFEGLQKAAAEKYDIVIVDTAGRLHNKENLMEELKKVKRVMGKALDGSPHETILVIDANSGQNALVQARQFNEVIGVSSLIVTKLDGTARGGMIVSIAEELGIGVQFIGLGEKLTDLRKFSATEYTNALLG